MHRFRHNEVFLLTGIDVVVIFPQGALFIVFNDSVWNGDTNFLLVLNRNFTFIMHRFRDNYFFLLANWN